MTSRFQLRLRKRANFRSSAGPRQIDFELHRDFILPRETRRQRRRISSSFGELARCAMASVGVADFAFCGILGEGEFGRVMMGRKHATSEVSMT